MGVQLWPFRTLTWMFSICGGLALLLATVGLAGVVIHAVNRRVREFGVRLSVGATPRDLLRRETGNRFAGEQDIAAIGFVSAGQHVEARCLAGAVRAHDARQPPLVECERNVLQHDLAPEALVQVPCLEERHRSARFHRGRRLP